MVDLQFHGKKRKAYSQENKSEKNRLTELPDDSLLHILSSLTMKEAGRTSILSKRWRYLWSKIPTLRFNSCNLSEEISSEAQEIQEVENPRYIRWVDQVVGLYSSSPANEFWVQCYLQADNVKNVDDWVRFAMKKKVKRLWMDVLVVSRGCYSLYVLPRFFSMSTLNYLKLLGLDVTGKALEKLLVTCPVLEYLCVENSDSVLRLKVVGQSLQLKHLIIRFCDNIKKLEISAPKLVDVTYHGPRIHVPFKSNPMLAKICLGGTYAIALRNTFMEHSSYLSQLKVLELILEDSAVRDMHSVNNFPKLERLKELSMHIYPCYPQLLYMWPLIDNCPSLYKFTLILEGDAYVGKRTLLGKRWAITPHHDLKIVEIEGLYGIAGFKFAVWLLNTAYSLEKIIINPHKRLYPGLPETYYTCEENRNVAKKLGVGEYLKPGIDLVIL